MPYSSDGAVSRFLEKLPGINRLGKDLKMMPSRKCRFQEVAR